MADSWQDKANELTQERIRQDHDDLNNDVAGRDTGRIKRFVSPEHIGSEATKADDDAFLMEVASQILTAEQQRQVEQLQRQFELYNQASALAMAEIDEEIALAQQEYQRIQENATILADGRRVYLDEENGHFYDEEDRRLSESDDIEANSNHQRGNSTRQQKDSTLDRIDNLRQERKDVSEYQAKKDELRERLEDNPEEAAEIEDELNVSVRFDPPCFL